MSNSFQFTNQTSWDSKLSELCPKDLRAIEQGSTLKFSTELVE